MQDKFNEKGAHGTRRYFPNYSLQNYHSRSNVQKIIKPKKIANTNALQAEVSRRVAEVCFKQMRNADRLFFGTRNTHLSQMIVRQIPIQKMNLSK